VLDATITSLLAELAEALPAGGHRDTLLQKLSACYRPGVSMSEAFGAFLSSLLPGLVVLDPCDPAVKTLMVPILKRELLESSPTSRLAAPLGQALLTAGYHQQFPVRAGFLNAFVVMEGQRRALALSGEGVEVRSLSRRISLDEAVAALEADPAAWSPGALLRPLVQDHLLPTAAYVGGPAEIAYHAQIGPSYAHFGIPRPVAFPRPGVTLVDSPAARALENEGLTLTDLQGDPEALLARWARESNPGIEPGFVRAREAITREMEAIAEALGALDPTLRAAAESAKGRALHQVEGLEEKAMRALKKRDQVRAERLRRTRDALFPGGTLQERVLGLIGLVARQGEAVLPELRERIDPWAKGHQVIAL
jgi:bacillithiol biosynthesis cysteine-adding enzyme BshC